LETGHDLTDLGTLGLSAPRKMAPPSSGAESREETARIMLVQAGGVCEGVHTTGDTFALEMKHGRWGQLWGPIERT
jgi:hypothetical protein